MKIVCCFLIKLITTPLDGKGLSQARFPDTPSLESYVKSVYSTGEVVSRTRRVSALHPQSVKVDELKRELRVRGASLIKRLERNLASEANQSKQF